MVVFELVSAYMVADDYWQLRKHNPDRYHEWELAEDNFNFYLDEHLNQKKT